MAKPANAKAQTSNQAPKQAQSSATPDAAAQTAKSAQAPSDAASLLKQDHRQVEALFEKFAQAKPEEKLGIVRQICMALIVHTQLEEELFYPACREKNVQSTLLDEAQVEHDGAKIMINELMCNRPGSEFYDAKATVLKEYIKHHVSEEEKSGEGIFAKAIAAGVDMNALGQRLQARKQELMKAAETSGFSVPNPRSLAIRTQSESDNDEEMQSMATENYRQRDQQGRFSSDDERGQYRSQGGGRYRDDDDDRGGRSGYRGNERERDEQGRFVSDDDDRGSYRSQGGGRYRDEEDERSSSRGGGGGRGGWFGDSEGHSEAAQRRGSSRSEGRYEEDDDRSSSRGGGRGHGGWFGDSEGHSEAAQRRWQSEGSGRGSSRSERDERDDNRRGGGNGGNNQRGWFGDPRGHSEASRRGWQNRE